MGGHRVNVSEIYKDHRGYVKGLSGQEDLELDLTEALEEVIDKLFVLQKLFLNLFQVD
jgi:hypothetical protein